MDDLKKTKCKLQILNKQLKDKSRSNDICVSSQEPNSSQLTGQEILTALVDLTKTELVSQMKIRDLNSELKEVKAQQEAEARARSAEDDLQRLRRKFGTKDQEENLYEHGKYDFDTKRTDKHRYKQDYRHQFYSPQDDYSYQHGNLKPKFQPAMDKYHRKYWKYKLIIW